MNWGTDCLDRFPEAVLARRNDINRIDLEAGGRGICRANWSRGSLSSSREMVETVVGSLIDEWIPTHFRGPIRHHGCWSVPSSLSAEPH